jgi:hypothetical protein
MQIAALQHTNQTICLTAHSAKLEYASGTHVRKLPNTICPLNLNPKNDTVYLSNRSRPYTYTTVTIEICRAPYETHALLHTAEGLCCSLIAIDPLHAQYASRSTVHRNKKAHYTVEKALADVDTEAETEALADTLTEAVAEAVAETVADTVAEGVAVTATGLGVGVGLITTHWLLMHSSSARQQRILFTRLSEGIRYVPHCFVGSLHTQNDGNSTCCCCCCCNCCCCCWLLMLLNVLYVQFCVSALQHSGPHGI